MGIVSYQSDALPTTATPAPDAKIPPPFVTFDELQRQGAPSCDTVHIFHDGRFYSFYLGDSPAQQTARFRQVVDQGLEEIELWEQAKQEA